MPEKILDAPTQTRNSSYVRREWKDQIDKDTGCAHFTFIFATDEFSRRARVAIPAVISRVEDGVTTTSKELFWYVTSEDPDHERRYWGDRANWKPRRDPLWRLLLWLTRAKHGIPGQTPIWIVKDPNPRGKSRELTLYDITGQTKSATAYKDSFLPEVHYSFLVIDLDDPDSGVKIWEERNLIGGALVDFCKRQKKLGRDPFHQPIMVTYNPNAARGSTRYSFDISEKPIPEAVLKVYREAPRPNLKFGEIPTSPAALRQVVENHLHLPDASKAALGKIWPLIWNAESEIEADIVRLTAEAKAVEGGDESVFGGSAKSKAQASEEELTPIDTGEEGPPEQSQTPASPVETVANRQSLLPPPAAPAKKAGRRLMPVEEPKPQPKAEPEEEPLDCPSCGTQIKVPRGAESVQCPGCAKRFIFEGDAGQPDGPEPELF